MSQDGASAEETSSPTSTSENNRSLIDIGSQFEDIPNECYTRDINDDIPGEEEEEDHAPAPVG